MTEQKITLSDLLQRIKQNEVWTQLFLVSTGKYIAEALRPEGWREEIIDDLICRDNHVANTGQGAFSHDEKARIRAHWSELSPLLKQLAEHQDEPCFEVYPRIEQFLNGLTDRKRWAEAHRLAVSLQPRIFCTVLSDIDLEILAEGLKKFTTADPWQFLPADHKDCGWYARSYAMTQLYKSVLPSWDTLAYIDYPWQSKVYLQQLNSDEERRDVSLEKLAAFFKANKNVIFTGAPGTGKTYLARRLAGHLEAHTGFVQFHPSYDYTDFVEGLRPAQSDSRGQLGFARQDGIFKRFCREALKKPLETYVFIIDELNRGELSRIFGELFYCLEPDYRGPECRVQTQYQNLITDESDPFKEGFYIPENVLILGTMNDIDRSVESMDFALRRRFAFREIRASDNTAMLDVLGDLKDKVLERMNGLNRAIWDEETNTGIEGLSPAYQIGGAYFRKLSLYLNAERNLDEALQDLWNYHLQGLIFEYLRGMPESRQLLERLRSAFLSADAESQDA